MSNTVGSDAGFSGLLVDKALRMGRYRNSERKGKNDHANCEPHTNKALYDCKHADHDNLINDEGAACLLKDNLPQGTPSVVLRLVNKDEQVTRYREDNSKIEHPKK
mmetsp:Transcript_7783/g.12457  ORF Transcript_7783/g.12457 Transcript_7783/m.12457 type:complete len:106 (-) Transcript_7783:1989-2306(-)